MLNIIKFGFFILKKQWIKSFYKWFKLFINKKFKWCDITKSDYIYWVYNFYNNSDYNSVKEFKEKIINSNSKLVINWFIPWVQVWSWWHFNIFRNIKHLDEKWHQNNIYIIWEHLHPDANSVKKLVDNYFVKLWKTKYYLYENVTDIIDSDINIWTSWYSIYFMIQHNNTKKKLYFVQDFEPWFYEKNSKYIFAENTYKMWLKTITAWKYLDMLMKRDYWLTSDFYDLWYDEKIYNRKNNLNNNRKNRLLFYWRHVTWRRWFELWILALNLLKKENPDIEIWLIWWDSYPEIPFKYTKYGILTHNELAEIYNNSLVWVSFSLTNYSLLPCEMMACWLPVIDILWENTSYVFNDWEWIILSESNPYEIKNNIIKIIKNKELYEDIQKKWLEFVKDKKWSNSYEKVEELIFNL